MSELSFCPTIAPVTLATLLASAEVPLPASPDPATAFSAVAALDRAGAGDVTAFGESEALDDLRATRAGACFVAARHAEHVPPGTIALVTEWPLAALARAAAVLHPRGGLHASLFERGGIDPAARVHSDAFLEQDVVVDPGAVIGARAEIGRATVIGANSTIGAGVRIGRGCIIDAQVSIRCALVGDRVAIRSGARIGLDRDPPRDGLPSFGRVIIQDDVTIGGNAVLERGNLDDTTIGERASIGPLVVIRAETTVARCEIIAGATFPPSAEMV